MVFGLLVWGCSAAQAALPAPQRQALVDLYQATQGPQWRQSANWLEDDPCEKLWHGVGCSADGLSVVSLHLPGNRLQGSLPDSLTALEALESLDLRGNLGLTGALPPLQAWPAMAQLNLSFNQFSGHLPSPLRLPRLQSLVLSNNLLTGPLPNLSGLPALQNLRLNHNQFSGSLPALSTLGSLQALDLSFNQFSGPLPELGRLPQLRTFMADWNRFQGPLPTPSGLQHLHILSASGNQLTGPLPPLHQLPALSVLALDHNQLSGALPRALDLPRLHQLNLAYNLFTGPLPDLSAAHELKRLQVEGNALSGPLPERPGQLIQADLCPNSLHDPAEMHEPIDAEPSWRGCAETLTAGSTSDARTEPEPPRLRRSSSPGRVAVAALQPAAGCPASRSGESTQAQPAYTECAGPQAPRRGGATSKPLPDLSVLPPWSEWLMALCALLAFVTTGLIWRLSWLGQVRAPPGPQDVSREGDAPSEGWVNSLAPAAGEDVVHHRPTSDQPSA